MDDKILNRIGKNILDIGALTRRHPEQVTEIQMVDLRVALEAAFEAGKAAAANTPKRTSRSSRTSR